MKINQVMALRQLRALGLCLTLSVSAALGLGHAGDVSPDPVDAQLSQVHVSRIGGADRFDVAVNVARRMFPAQARQIYIASGANFPDALSVGSAAMHWREPLLIVMPDRIPPAVADEIKRLKPAVVKVAGGERSVSAAVMSELQALVPGVRLIRLGGMDRYEVSRAVSRDGFSRADSPIIVTGSTFADALSSGPAAGQDLNPVVLVDGHASSIDSETVELLKDLESSSVRIVGGRDSVSDSIATMLSATRKVTRFAGADRFEASVAVNKASFTTSDTVFLATGSSFADALTGGVLAGSVNAPLYVVPSNCVPQAVLAEIQRLGATNVVLLGGEASLSPSVFDLIPCAS